MCSFACIIGLFIEDTTVLLDITLHRVKIVSPCILLDICSGERMSQVNVVDVDGVRSVLEPSTLAQAVALRTRVREVTGSNLGRNTENLH
jgi:hypothetical protein